MASGICPVTFFLYSLILFQGFQVTIGHRKLFTKEEYENSHLQLPGNSDRALDPKLNMFFHYKGLKAGAKMAVYFPTKDSSTTPHFLSREESDSIPFSLSKLPYLLELFQFPADSKQGLAMKSTLHHCEFPALTGETKFCATSLESMLDSIQEVFGQDSRFKVLTTNYLLSSLPPLQNYTVSESPKEISAEKMLGCHKLPYPYAVFYCHGQAGDRKLYRVLLDGENGGRVDAVAICHMDTSQWDPDHVAFKVMGTVPGAAPVCHFFPADNLVWIPGP